MANPDDMKPVPARLSEQDFATLNAADILSEGRVASVLNANGLCAWTVCPECHVDDFIHVEDCELDPSNKE
jgi:hypothetical protein